MKVSATPVPNVIRTRATTAYRMFVKHEPVTVQFVDRLFQYVMQGCGRPARDATNGSPFR